MWLPRLDSVASAMIGVLPINKPGGFSSRQVVNRIQRLVRPVKVGHTGTLDPLATGVLLIAVGPATRLTEFSHEQPKRYEADFLLGRRSDTLDIEGTVEAITAAPVDEQQWQAAAAKFAGEIEQIPPRYSAIHIDGKRAYDRARSGEDFEMPSRLVQIDEIETRNFEYPLVTFQVQCGTGTYIRTLGSDIARACSSDAVMSRLVRTQMGAITIDQCIDLKQLETLSQIECALLPPQQLVSHLPHVLLSHSDVQSVRNGVPLGHVQAQGSENDRSNRVVAIDDNEQLVAILERQADHRWRSLRVFQQAAETTQPAIMSKAQSPES